jgi:hypothetical protein
MAAMRLCMDRIDPARKDTPVTFEMPKLETAADAIKAMAATHVGHGERRPDAGRGERSGEACRYFHSRHRGARIRPAA